MRKPKLKAALALVMALSMLPTSIPVRAQVAQTAVERKNQAVEKKQNTESRKTSYAEGEAIILYKNSAATAKKFSRGSSIGKNMEIAETYDFSDTKASASAKGTRTMNSGVSVSLVKSDMYSTEDLIKILKKRSDIKYAEPNYKIKAMDVEDPYKQYQWALDNLGQNGGTEGFDINADTEALKKSADDKEKVIALVDTGIDYTHEELQNVVWNNPINSKQFKGEHGYDFINYDGDPLDDNGHGTHCSGIMAAASDNGVGIAGTANSENIKIMGLKILDEEGYGYGMEAIGAYNYIYKAQQLGVNVVAVNNSWGAGAEEGEDFEIFLQIINLIGEEGALSICAAGNEGNNNDYTEVIPANLESPYVISVAASNENDELAGFSNYGESVDLAAPGTDILSTVSYNTFNPVLYENKDELCAIFEDFETGKLVETMKKGKLTNTAVEESDICYGLDSDSKGNMTVALDGETYFGNQTDGTQSIQWTVKNAKESGIYKLYLPYMAEESSTPLYSSVMVKVSRPSGLGEDLFGLDQSILYVSDGMFDEEGTYDEGTETIIGGTYIDDGNYWNLCTGQAAESVDEEQQRALSIQFMAGEDGDYTVYIDKMGISKGDVEDDAFGKYDFYNGTSMATPYVTGAVAAIADAFGEETAQERKARILGSVRKSENLEGMVKTGGVLDLSNVENPNMTIEKISLNEENQLEIYGYYLTGATIKIDGSFVEPIAQTERMILVDGTKYVNKSIAVEIEKGEECLTEQYFLLHGKQFDEFAEIEGCLSGGTAVSDGENLYYVNDEGNVFKGALVKKDGSDMFDWSDSEQQYTTDLFGDSYDMVVDYTIKPDSDFVLLNKKLFAIISIDAGYSEDSVLAYFDEKEGWKKYADLPEDFAELEGITLGAYDGRLYIIGGFNQGKGICSKKVKSFDAEKGVWEQVVALPEGRCFSKALQVGNKLVVTLGGNGKDDVPKNLIFNGKNWGTSKADMGEIVEPDMYYFESGDTFDMFPLAKAQTGLVENGIVYTNLKVGGLGDTFIYDVSSDKYVTTGYCLDGDSLNGDQVVATTVQNNLYVLYGWGPQQEDWDIEFWKNSKTDSEEVSDAEMYTESDVINVCTMPIQSGFIRVIDESSSGAYVQGAGYYLPGDTVKLVAKAENVNIKSFTVNGVKVSADSKGAFVYEEKMQGNIYEIKVSAEAETVESKDNANNNTVKNDSTKIPINSDNKTNQSIGKNSKVDVGNFTYKVTSFTAAKKTVTCLSLNNKSATKAVVPATIKINGTEFKVTGISSNAFKNCKKLKSITVGKNITAIGKNAWKGCKKLKKVTIKSSTIKKFGKGLLKGTSKSLTVKVPKKAKKSYSKKLKKAGWKGKVK